MAEAQWVSFDESIPETHPAADTEVIVEMTETGHIGPAIFHGKGNRFTLYLAPWGRHGAVKRWRYEEWSNGPA